MYRHMQISTGIWSHLPLYGARPRARERLAGDDAMRDAQGADRLGDPSRCDAARHCAGPAGVGRFAARHFRLGSRKVVA